MRDRAVGQAPCTRLTRRRDMPDGETFKHSELLNSIEPHLVASSLWLIPVPDEGLAVWALFHRNGLDSLWPKLHMRPRPDALAIKQHLLLLHVRVLRFCTGYAGR